MKSEGAATTKEEQISLVGEIVSPALSLSSLTKELHQMSVSFTSSNLDVSSLHEFLLAGQAAAILQFSLSCKR